MRKIKESKNHQRWPRCKVDEVKCRKQDLVIRISNWLKDKDEPAYDVEVYIGGVYDWNESKTFSLHLFTKNSAAKAAAIAFAQSKIKELL